jgi:TonB family protein
MMETWKQWEGQTVVSRDDESIHFQLNEYLGGTSFGPVFLTDLETEPGKVAVKLRVTHPASHDAQIARWRRAAKLSHPHLLRLFHTGRCRMDSSEVLFSIMEFAEEDLSQILPERPLTASETSDVLKSSLEALAYLHSNGFVHGRLKPANIMAVKDQLKLASDGLYLAGDQVSVQDRSPYHPPEIHEEAKAAGISPAADVWSLGMTLAEILTQHRPSWQQEDQREPVLPNGLPEPFLEIIRNCLRRDPQQRWTIDQIAARLYPPLQASIEPIAVRQEAAQTKGSKRWLYLVPITATAFAAAFVAGSGILHRQQPAPVQPQVQEAGTVTTSQSIPDGDRVQKPSHATPIANDSSNNQPSPKIVEASLPSSRATEPNKRPASDSKTDGIVQQVLPEVPQKARDTIEGKVKVKVRVHVDAPGEVTEAELDAPSKSTYFNRLALEAAQRWKFTPAPSGAEDASREWLLRFEFGNTETKVFPTQASRNAH